MTLILAADPSTLYFTVADQGAGLSDEQQGRLFTPFSQADQSISRTHGGTGLGLALSRDLARLMGGDLTVESAAGEGARFTLAISRVDIAAPETASPPPQEVLPPLRVLAVDDHEINRRAMSAILEAFGVEPIFAVDGADALRALSTTSFDAMLIDVNLPGLDGLEVTRRLRRLAGPNRSIPVIAVTGATGAEDRARCFAAGMTGFVAKPIEPAELLAAIGDLTAAPEPALAVAAAN